MLKRQHMFDRWPCDSCMEVAVAIDWTETSLGSWSARIATLLNDAGERMIEAMDTCAGPRWLEDAIAGDRDVPEWLPEAGRSWISSVCHR